MSSASGGDTDKRDWKLLVDPLLKKGLQKLYRFDGTCQGSRSSTHNVVLPTDPRTHIPRFYARSEPIDMPLPSFKIDENYIGAPPAREVSFFGLNDNINKAFLLNLCGKCGAVDEHDVKIYYDPKTKRHLGLASVIFKKTNGAKQCRQRYHRASVMGKTIDVTLDPFGNMVKETFRSLTAAGKSGRKSDPEPTITPPQATQEITTPIKTSASAPNLPTSSTKEKRHEQLQRISQHSQHRQQIEQQLQMLHMLDQQATSMAQNSTSHVLTPPPAPQVIPEDPLIVKTAPAAQDPSYCAPLSGPPTGPPAPFLLPMPPWPLTPGTSQAPLQWPPMGVGPPPTQCWPRGGPAQLNQGALPVPPVPLPDHSSHQAYVPPGVYQEPYGAGYDPQDQFSTEAQPYGRRDSREQFGDFRKNFRGSQGMEPRRQGGFDRRGSREGYEREGNWAGGRFGRHDDAMRRKEETMERTSQRFFERDYSRQTKIRDTQLRSDERGGRSDSERKEGWREEKQETSVKRNHPNASAYEDLRKQMEEMFKQGSEKKEEEEAQNMKRKERSREETRPSSETDYMKRKSRWTTDRNTTQESEGQRRGKNADVHDEMRRMMEEMFKNASEENQGTSGVGVKEEVKEEPMDRSRLSPGIEERKNLRKERNEKRTEMSPRRRRRERRSGSMSSQNSNHSRGGRDKRRRDRDQRKETLTDSRESRVKRELASPETNLDRGPNSRKTSDRFVSETPLGNKEDGECDEESESELIRKRDAIQRSLAEIVPKEAEPRTGLEAISSDSDESQRAMEAIYRGRRNERRERQSRDNIVDDRYHRRDLRERSASRSHWRGVSRNSSGRNTGDWRDARARDLDRFRVDRLRRDHRRRSRSYSDESVDSISGDPYRRPRRFDDRRDHPASQHREREYPSNQRRRRDSRSTSRNRDSRDIAAIYGSDFGAKRNYRIGRTPDASSVKSAGSEWKTNRQGAWLPTEEAEPIGRSDHVSPVTKEATPSRDRERSKSVASERLGEPSTPPVTEEREELSLESRIQSILHGAQKEVIKAVMEEEETPTPVQDEPISAEQSGHVKETEAPPVSIPSTSTTTTTNATSSWTPPQPSTPVVTPSLPSMAYPPPIWMKDCTRLGNQRNLSIPSNPIPQGIDPIAYQQQMMHIIQCNMGFATGPFPTYPLPPVAMYGAPYISQGQAWGLMPQMGQEMPGGMPPVPPGVPSQGPCFTGMMGEENDKRRIEDIEAKRKLDFGVSVTRQALSVLGRELNSVLDKDIQRRAVDGSGSDALDAWWERGGFLKVRTEEQHQKEQKESRLATEQKQAEEMKALVVAPISSAIAELFGRKSTDADAASGAGLEGLPGFGLRASMPHFKVPKKKLAEDERRMDTPDEQAKYDESTDDEAPVRRRRISSSSSESDSGRNRREKSPEASEETSKEKSESLDNNEAKQETFVLERFGEKASLIQSDDDDLFRPSETKSEENQEEGMEEESSESDEESEDSSSASSSISDEDSELSDEESENEESSSEGEENENVKAQPDSVEAKLTEDEINSVPILQKLALHQSQPVSQLSATENEQISAQAPTAGEKATEAPPSDVMVLSGVYNPWAYDHFYMVPPRKWPKRKRDDFLLGGIPFGNIQDIFPRQRGRPPKLLKPVPEYTKRPGEVERANIYRFLSDGLDGEDAEYLNQGFEALKAESSDKFPWIKKAAWIPHPVEPTSKRTIRRHLTSELENEPKTKRGKFGDKGSDEAHRTGSARTEGYYKASKDRKPFMRRATHAFERTIEQNIQDINAAKQQAQLGREARANQRRILSQLGSDAETSDLLKINQLKFRKKLVRFGRSVIHGWGLFALETIQPDEMIVEYVGQKIRFNVAERREMHYEKTGIGSSYLFRIDMDQVIDATKQGALARFINHSCSPSCYAKVITVDGEKRIVIYSKEVIRPGEEITYDYKFPLEDDKIPCLCGAPNCRGSLN